MKTGKVYLGDIAKFIRGVTFKPTDLVPLHEKKAVVCMRTKNVQKDLDEGDLISIPPKLVKRKEQFLKKGDILVSTANSWELVGKCCWVPALNYTATAGGFISILRGNEKEIWPRYLYYWLNSGKIQFSLRNCGRQTTNISNLAFDRALNLPIPVPSLEEQKRIAAILDKADAIRRKRRQAIQLADEFLRSVFLDMSGDPVSNQKAWQRKKIEQLGKVVTGNTPSRQIRGNFGDHSTNSLKGMVSKGIFQEIELICPPYSLQNKFGFFFSYYLKCLDKQKLQLKESKNLFNSLCQKAFRGEL